MNMYCYKPQPRDHRQHPGHKQKLSERLKAVADVLGMGTKNLENVSIGFADEATFQTYGNSARLWSFGKGLIRKENTNRTKQNCFAFYAIRAGPPLRQKPFSNHKERQRADFPGNA